MRRALAALVLTAAGLIPLLMYHPHAAVTAREVPTTAAAPGPVSSGPPVAGGTSPARSARTINGSVVDTEFGQFQVQATFRDHALTDVRLIAEPGDGHSRRIAEAAEPTLRQEALQAQSAQLDAVSGATTTSAAYAQSLQAAIDAGGH
jgi:uncharacterized protein with FMN-binding domain